MRVKIFSFLTLSPETRFQFSNLKSTNPSNQEAWVTNLHEIKSSLAQYGWIPNKTDGKYSLSKKKVI